MQWNLRCAYQVQCPYVDPALDENIESLIEEIEKRPPIYNKSLREYANINIKKQLWEEVCAAVIPIWSGLEGENKTRAGKFTQTLS